MNEEIVTASLSDTEGEVSVLRILSLLVQRRRLIVWCVLAGGVVGAVWAICARAVYSSTATFLPYGSESGSSGLAAAASRFGISVPSSGVGWGPPVFVEILRSRGVLESMLDDSVTVVEEANKRTKILDMFSDSSLPHGIRVDKSARGLAAQIVVTEVKNIGGVRVQVVAKQPSVALSLAQSLLVAVNRFNLTSRKSQATLERQFVEQRATEAEAELRQRETRLREFLEQNRAPGNSPALTFQLQRLQRDLSLREQSYLSLLQSIEEARLREVRDTPVISVLEQPVLPLLPEPRKRVQKLLLGLLAGFLSALLLAAADRWVTLNRKQPSADAKELFELLKQSLPSFGRRAGKL